MSVKERTVCDNTNVNADQLANFSGNWNNTGNAGVFQLNVNQTASNTNTNYSARQMSLNYDDCFTLHFTTLPLGKRLSYQQLQIAENFQTVLVGTQKGSRKLYG